MNQSREEKTGQATNMLANILPLVDNFRSRAEQTKRDRHLPDESVQELQDTGFFLALQPKNYGGLELDPQDFFLMQSAIAEGCMSTAWASGIIAVHAFQLALMDQRAQEDVWGKDIHTRMSSSYAPLGKVTPVEGGFQLSGRWGWSSGCNHCTWVLLGAIVPDEGYRTFLLPISDYEIIDTWNSMGLQGTGSNDIVVDDVFVPDYRTHKQADGFSGQNPGIQINTAPLYLLPWAQTFIRVVSTPAIGAAREGLRLYKGMVTGKASGDITKLAGDTSTVERIASAANMIDEMEALLYRNFDKMMTTVTRGGRIPLEDRALYRYQASLVIEKSIAVIDSLFSSAGGSSVFTGSPIQQRFLDIHTARAHVANNPVPFARNYGAIHLGADNQDLFI
ncbi:MAG: 3-hydroxy-9,10-secoandrosta-1,3,5(10)-triene-9,17-dione monooxygenase [Halieaceae bacterium]|jgi:3-hydroxy-9,10-secoandrosta-1,3,5(10)-triene-9,17-dione monooxygenase